MLWLMVADSEFPQMLTVTWTKGKTNWFNRKDFGCISLPSGRSKRKSLQSSLPSVGRAKTAGVPYQNMEECYEK